MVFQNPNLQLINQTVLSEIAFGPENLALPQPEIAARVGWCLEVTGMGDLRRAAVVTLSGGQKQRTAIAATLAMRPRVLVLDEPLSDLDPVGAQEVLATLRRLTRDGATGVVIIEHRVDEVAPWADRVLLMDNGRVVLDQPPRQAWSDPGPWLTTGVGIPDVVRLAQAVPAAFPAGLPLSVDEAVGALRDTQFAAALAAAAGQRAAVANGSVANGRTADGRMAAATAAGGVTAGTGAAAPAGPPVLSWAGVSVDFDGKRAVDDVTLEVGDGEWVAMIGANGSGKTTLTGLTVGLGKPSRGDVRFRGQPIRPGRVFEHAVQVALLLQAADEMLFETTVLRELEFGFRFRARPADPVLDVPGAIEFFGFNGLESASPWELSQGGRQRLALAALLVGAPGVLVLDEPTTGQDAQHMQAFLRLLARIRSRTGLTVITVTHDIRGLASRASRVVLLGDGQVRLDGPPSQVFAHTDELARWGVLAPPLARLQTGLLGGPAADVLLDGNSVADVLLSAGPPGPGPRAGAAAAPGQALRP
jgi:energy-coupling factor transport system ATP-binding protein